MYVKSFGILTVRSNSPSAPKHREVPVVGVESHSVAARQNCESDPGAIVPTEFTGAVASAPELAHESSVGVHDHDPPSL